MPVTDAGMEALKVWVLTGCLGTTLLIVGYFLKRVLDNFDERSEHLDSRVEKSMEALTEQNVKIIQILAQVTYLSDRLSSIEHRLDKRGSARQ